MPIGAGEARPVAIVTGASYGIGAAAAIGLAQDGFDVCLTDLDPGALQETAASVTEAGAKALPAALDVTVQASVEALVAQTLGAFGRIDALVNNAGIPFRRAALEVSREEWDRVLAVNLTGAFFMTQRVGRHLIEAGRPGSVVSLASTHGVVGFPLASAYGIAKAGIVHMTRMLAIEWAPHRIRVNAVAPGTTETRSRAGSLADPVRRSLMLGRIPLGRFGTAEEMAAAIRYLLSPQASYVTGQTLLLDGGLTAG